MLHLKQASKVTVTLAAPTEALAYAAYSTPWLLSLSTLPWVVVVVLRQRFPRMTATLHPAQSSGHQAVQ